MRSFPKNEDETRFDSFQQFVFETVLRLIALRLSDSRVKGKDCESQLAGFDYRVTLSTTVCTALLVPFTALCATFLAVIAVFSPRSSPCEQAQLDDAANANAEREKY